MKNTTKHTKRMKRKNTNLLAQASAKSSEPTALEECLPMLDLILEMKHDIEAVSAELGLKIMHRYMDQKIQRRCGPWGAQSHYRHGTQAGYVVFHGRKVALQRPRLRDKAAGEAALQSYRLFQQDGRMQRAVARKLIRQVSTRNYAGAIDDCLEGYGVGKSSVSRHWSTGTGYMLGDYLGIAETVSPDVPAVPVWIDTRTGSPDPFATRVGIASNVTFRAWRAARFSLAQVNDPLLGAPGSDPELDGVPNALEYGLGMNPWLKDAPLFVNGLADGVSSRSFTVSYERIRFASGLNWFWLMSSNANSWTPATGVTETIAANVNARLESVSANFGPATNGARFYRLGATPTN
jgi:hypothetical protein